MKRSVLSALFFLGFGVISRAVAADFAPVPEPMQLYDWTGFYLGATGGWAIDGDFHAQPKDIPWINVHHDNGNGGLVGGTVGYNWEVPNVSGSGVGVVLGAEINGF